MRIMRAFREMRSVGRRMTAMTLVAMMSVAPALAAPGVTTADVKFRSGPGTNYPSTEGLASGSTSANAMRAAPGAP
jgi:uncharacterized protein YraI